MKTVRNRQCVPILIEAFRCLDDKAWFDNMIELEEQRSLPAHAIVTADTKKISTMEGIVEQWQFGRRHAALVRAGYAEPRSLRMNVSNHTVRGIS